MHSFVNNNAEQIGPWDNEIGDFDLYSNNIVQRFNQCLKHKQTLPHLQHKRKDQLTVQVALQRKREIVIDKMAKKVKGQM